MRITRILAKDPGKNILLDSSYSYDTMDNILSKQTGQGTYNYTYDALSRLTDVQVDIPGQENEGFSYDAVGNRLTEEGVEGEWAYNDNNELLTFATTEYTYDANGNATQLLLDGAVMFTYHYNAQDRLVQVDDVNGDTLAEYSYDPFGRRLWKDVGGTRTYFFYADEGLVAEYDASGTEIRVYGYRPDSAWTTDPLWLKQGTEYYFYQNDHLGTPQKLVAQNGAMVWSAQYSAFGEATIEVETITNNLRFPGQYVDEETGLHYNWFRYYAPKIGRYVSVDPIGVLAGMNAFTYADNNSLTKSDPLGLWVELDKIVPPEEAFTVIEKAIIQRKYLLPQVTSQKYKLIHWLGTLDAKMYGSPLEREYLDSFLVAAQAVQPKMKGGKNFKNQFVFTCKYGWIDVGHFWAMALMTFSMRLYSAIPLDGPTTFDEEAMAKLPYYVTTGLIEGIQGAYLITGHWLLSGGVIDWLDKDLTDKAQSTGTPEDLGSNWQGALYAAQILGYLAQENPAYAMGPDHIMTRLWDKFLYDNQAITFSGKDDVYDMLDQDARNFWGKEDGKDVYIGPRWVGWAELKKQSIAYCQLCNGDLPKPGIPTYIPKYIPHAAQ